MAQDDDDFTIGNDPEEYALSGKVLLIAVIILFALVTFILLLNLLARWRSVRAHRREFRRRNRMNRRAQLFFYVNNNPAVLNRVAAPNRGLEPEVLNSLPVFSYDSTMEEFECSVCLSVFEDDDKGRVLPKCGHYFHAECVDMWFHSHSTCPLCRSKVELIQEPESNRSVIGVEASEPVEDSGSRAGGTTSYRCPRKDLEVSKSRRLSLKRLLSMNRKNPGDVTTTSYGVETSGIHPMGVEIDLESRISQGN